MFSPTVAPIQVVNTLHRSVVVVSRSVMLPSARYRNTSKIYFSYLKCRKSSSSVKSQCGRMCMLSDRDRRPFRRIGTKNKQTLWVPKQKEGSFISIAFLAKLQFENHSSVMIIAEKSGFNKTWNYRATKDNNMIWWLLFNTVFTSGRVCIWRAPWQNYKTAAPACRLTVEHGGGSVMLWAAKSWLFVCPMITLLEYITDKNNVDILVDQIHPMIVFPNGYGVFQDYKAPVRT